MVKRRLRVFVASLVAASFVPVGVIVTLSGWKDWKRTVASVEEEMIRILLLIKQDRETKLRALQTTMIALTNSQAILNGPEEECQRLLRVVAEHNPLYANIGMADLDGKVHCCAYPLPEGLNFSDQPMFRQALETGNFSAGGYNGTAIPGKRTLLFTQPVPKEGGGYLGVIFVAIDLVKIAEMESGIRVPYDGIISSFDHDGRCLYRIPDALKWIGKESEFFRYLPYIEKSQAHDLREITVEGREISVFLRKIDVQGGDDHYLVAVVDWKKVWVPFRNALLLQLFYLGLIALLGVGAAWMAGRLLILKPTQNLLKVIQARQRGDFSLRAGDVATGGEFHVIGEAFDEMTDVLERRIRDLHLAQEALRKARYELEERVEQRTRDLRLAKERLQDAIETIDAGFAMFDAEERLVVWNRAYAQMYGDESSTYLREGMSAREILDYWVRKGGLVNGKPADQGWADRRYAAIRNADGVVEEELVGGRWIRTSVKRMRDGGTVALRTDVTDIRSAEEEIRRKAEALRRSNRELEQFAYVASHDLQEPLRMVASYTQLLARRYGDRLDEDAKAFIQYAVNGVKRMQAFIRDLLKFSRVETHGQPFQPVDLNKVVAEVMETFRYVREEAGAKVEIGELPVVEGDPFQLAQLFQNLIGNSFKFRSERPLEIRIQAEPAGPGMWTLSVADNGIGFDEEDGERIFEIFHRLNPQDNLEGTGIGLGIAKRIVERHGGKIWARARKGEGATFFFTLRSAQSEGEG